jgi:hypothetical protein
MQVDIRQPMIQGSDREQLSQIRSYLFQLREQLQWAFENVEATGGGSEQTGGTQIINTTTTVTRPPTEAEAIDTFNAIKNLIIKSGDIVDAYYNDINTRLVDSKTYVMSNDYSADKTAINAAINGNTEAFLAHQSFADGELAHSRDVEEAHAKAIKDNADAFNVFKNETIADIEENANNITIAQTRVEALGSVFQDGENAAYIKKSSGYIKTGFLSGDEYGVEVGQTELDNGRETYVGSARFTPGKVAFYDDIAYSEGKPEPSAWLSKRRLHAAEVEATERQQIGGFVDTVDMLTGDVTTRWAPKEGD